MARTTISWCDFTFNPWWGCFKISAGCTNCYAATFDRRVHGRDSEHWARDGVRRWMSEDYWKHPLEWNKAARLMGVRRRVFVGSMCDWAEEHPDPAINLVMNAARERLFQLIPKCEWLDFLLLTKRIDNAVRHLPWCRGDGSAPWPNVWLGTTVENQEMADVRIPILSTTPAVVRFLSCEPLLGLIDKIDLSKIHWLIAGAESGPKARECDPEWIRELRDRCKTDGVKFFLKQAVWKPPFTMGMGSRTKSRGFGGSMVELPYLDGVQHTEVPNAA